MTALLVWKVIIPFLLVACCYRIINKQLGVFESGTFFIVIALSDVMALNFFFLVKDVGSWKDIGTSISHFALANAFILIQLLLFAITNVMISNRTKTKYRPHQA